jgi:DNA (cytosine-5)-methyltransferase 1
LPKNLNIPRNTPKWKKIFLKKNAEFYKENKILIDKWLKKYDRLKTFPPSRRKFEWQAQDTKSLLDTIMHFRPSGIRAKKATYVPALVAITQTTILGKHKRRLTVREGARLQGLPEWFDFLDQSTAQSFKQLGNGVNIGVVYNVVKAQVLRDLELLEKDSDLVKSILQAPNSPDEYLSKFHIPEKTKKESKGKKGNSLRSISSA